MTGEATAAAAFPGSGAGSLKADPRAADWVRAGHIRLALFLPQYGEDAATGAITGAGTGLLAIDLVGELAARLGIAARSIGYPTPADVMASLKAGAADVAFMGIAPSRVAQLGFSPAVFQFDFTYLVPAKSGIRSTADADRPGVRIAFVDHHAAAMTLRGVAKHAELLANALPDDAFAMLRAGKADAFAFPRSVLADFSAQWPGSRVLADSYGINRVGIATRPDNAQRIAFIGDFVEAAKASGLVRQVIERNGLLHEYQVSPRHNAAGG